MDLNPLVRPTLYASTPWLRHKKNGGIAAFIDAGTCIDLLCPINLGRY